jgi:uncharacterized protein (TIGR02246 family)
MSVDEVRSINGRMIAGWNAQDVEAVLDGVADSIVWTEAGAEPLRGKDAFRQYLDGWFKAFPDFVARVVNEVVTEDTIAVELLFGGTNTGPLELAPGAPAIPATGARADDVRGAYFMRVKDGKAAEVSAYPDNMGMLTQLGLMPE